jgi:phytoene dehydrogenase-like protein
VNGARYDAVVVGGGHNGLVAAITLAEHGRSVLVCEAEPRLGGAVATDELTLPGFRHDVFSAVYPAAAASPVLSRLPLERHGLRWVHPPVAMAHPLPGGRAAALYRDVERTAASLDALAPGDGRHWEAFATPYVEHFGALRATMLAGFPPIAGALRLTAGLRLSGILEFARLLLLPASALGAELFASEGARAWLYGSVLHGDVPPDESGSAIAGAYLNLLGHGAGWPSPEGGAGRLVDALVGHLHELGGQTRTQAPVEQVVAAGGRVRGVRLASGETVRADTVIGDLTPAGLVRLAGHALPADYVAKLGRFRPGPETIKVDWALSAPVPWEAEEVRRAGTVHVGGPADEILRSLRQQRAGALPDAPFLLFGQQSLADPTRAPAGQHTGWAYTHPPANVDWATETDRMVDRMEAQVERFAPGFRDRIIARHVLPPAGLEALNRNLRRGDVGAGSYALDQVVFRPLPKLFPYRTPIGGLYLGSASTFPGGATHGVPGHAAARLALAESRLRRLVPGGRR